MQKIGLDTLTTYSIRAIFINTNVTAGKIEVERMLRATNMQKFGLRNFAI